MTHRPDRGRPLLRLRLIGLQWLFASDDHRLAQTHYEGKESATDRASRLEAQTEDQAKRARRQKEIRHAAQRGQQWEETIYVSCSPTSQGEAHRSGADGSDLCHVSTQPTTAIVPTSTGADPHALHGHLPMLPPGFNPAAEDASPGQRHADGRQGGAFTPFAVPSGRTEPVVSGTDTPHRRRAGLYVVTSTSTPSTHHRPSTTSTPTAETGGHG
ncbi:hypothetical protein ACODT5_00175 [Streptomyces sp. 5.8]|uniref:hypothetical protein n=1 Tax=Streptomyces sp. 5.8 TaxID=3406571 RepID=UPI003BB563CB